MHITCLNHVHVSMPPEQEAAMRHFYEHILGLNEIPKPEVIKPNGGIWYQLGDLQLHVGIEAEVVRSKRHVALEVDSLNQWQKHLQANGIALHEEPSIPGFTRLSCWDPGGNRWELMERLK